MNQEGKFQVYLSNYEEIINQSLQELKSENVLSRIWSIDYTLWKSDPREISNRLGWLKSPELMQSKISELSDFSQDIIKEKFTTAVLLGMGGSSLAPEVFRKTFGIKRGYLDLIVLDSTDPGAVNDVYDRCDPSKTLFIVSTKSGGTVETLSFMKYFYNRVLQQLGENRIGKHFVAITDPGSGLEKIAKHLHFRRVFLNDPDIGGRYSVLSYFGLLPAALLGVDLEVLLARAAQEVEYDSPEQELQSPAAILGLIMGILAKQGRDKLTFIMSEKIQYFGSWVEQLIAESTGKEGRGILPVVGEEILDVRDYTADRIFVFIHLKADKSFEDTIKKFSLSGHPVMVIVLDDIYELGKEFFKWEIATVIAGWSLKINPFDQPNVESAKILARDMVKSYKESGMLKEGDPVYTTNQIQFFGDVAGKSVKEIFSHLIDSKSIDETSDSNRSYIAIQAYIKPDSALNESLHHLRTLLQKKYRLATTVGYGPRFLHSTGQLHKGDAGHGIFIQLSADMPADL
ncbi:MAG: glucose-6-phosphate isomerase, partial [Calditrichia bacterium]|nr:glucose-6-phosphate isomerase [Calditrichia bacterium]